MRTFSCVIFLYSAVALQAQTCTSIITQVTVLPEGTVTDFVPKAHNMTPIEVDIQNSSTVPCTVSFPQVSQSVRQVAGAPLLIAPSAAQLNLTGSAAKSGWAKAGSITLFIVKLAAPAGAAAGLAGAISKTAALIISGAASGIVQEGPQVASVFQSQAPNLAMTLQSIFVSSSTVTLQPGSWVTTYEYSARAKRGKKQ